MPKNSSKSWGFEHLMLLRVIFSTVNAILNCIFHTDSAAVDAHGVGVCVDHAQPIAALATPTGSARVRTVKTA